MRVIFDKPKLNRKTPEENIALLDKWVSDTADKLNILFGELERNKDGTAETSDQSD